MSFAINVVVSACMISLASWLSRRYPTTAGFMVALPLASMLVLPLSYFEHQSTENSFLLAKSIFVAIPVRLPFVVPFLLSSQYPLSYWQASRPVCAAPPLRRSRARQSTTVGTQPTFGATPETGRRSLIELPTD